MGGKYHLICTYELLEICLPKIKKKNKKKEKKLQLQRAH